MKDGICIPHDVVIGLVMDLLGKVQSLIEIERNHRASFGGFNSPRNILFFEQDSYHYHLAHTIPLSVATANNESAW